MEKQCIALYWHEQQRIKDSINKKEHKAVPLP
jgi:hypothetical protein